MRSPRNKRKGIWLLSIENEDQRWYETEDQAMCAAKKLRAEWIGPFFVSMPNNIPDFIFFARTYADRA